MILRTYTPRFAQPAIQITRVSSPLNAIRKLLKSYFVRMAVLGLWLFSMVIYQVLGRQPKLGKPPVATQVQAIQGLTTENRHTVSPVEVESVLMPQAYELLTASKADQAEALQAPPRPLSATHYPAGMTSNALPSSSTQSNSPQP